MPKNYDENLAEYKQLKDEASGVIDQLIRSKNYAIKEKAEYSEAVSSFLERDYDSIIRKLNKKITEYTDSGIKDLLTHKVIPQIKEHLRISKSETSTIKEIISNKYTLLEYIAEIFFEDFSAVGISVKHIGINTKTGELTMNNIGIGKFLTIDTENKSVELSNTKKSLFKYSMKELIRDRLLQYSGDVRAVSDSNILNYMWENKKQMLGAGKSLTGSFIVLEISSGNAHSVKNNWGYITLRDGTQPDWWNCKGKYKFLEQYPQIVTVMKNDTESNDYIYYYEI